MLFLISSVNVHEGLCAAQDERRRSRTGARRAAQLHVSGKRLKRWARTHTHIPTTMMMAGNDPSAANPLPAD